MASLNTLQGALGRRRAAHLLRRASFRYTRARIDELAKLDATEAVDNLLQLAPLQLEQPVYAAKSAPPAPWINPPKPPSEPLPAEDDTLKWYVIGWWLNEALHDPGAGHRMAFFFHQYLSVTPDAGTSMTFFDYLMLLRWGCLGNFKKLVTKMILDNGMLEYINNNQNYASNPNLNYAREFFELHTIGAGPVAGPNDYTNYTEHDIQQAARVLTGFSNARRHQYQDPETGIPAGRAYPQSHDFGTKTFSARFNNAVIKPPTHDAAGMYAELHALVDMVFAQEETARLFCRRLYRYFVGRDIDAEIENDIIAPLAQTFREENFEIKPVVKRLLTSEHFYDADDANSANENVGALIRSPLDLVLHTLSFFNVPIPDPLTKTKEHYETFWRDGIQWRLLDWAGMFLFYPPDVAGYPSYYQAPDYQRQFFNSSTVIARYKWPEMLITGTHAWGPGAKEPLGTRFDFAAWLRDSGVISEPGNSAVLVQELLQYLYPEEPDLERFDYFHDEILLNGLPSAAWTNIWLDYLSTGDDSEVRIPLRRLFNALLYAPEYQVF
ncbi:MAG: DUF1800 domain-containing protein [Saprospiraceae bacterium]|nr:DUF1800 domain-containing protein [Saprospiraceae bacterium]MDW8482935.1 DUF1800 family protein [Saprospiraceae bacterium]